MYGVTKFDFCTLGLITWSFIVWHFTRIGYLMNIFYNTLFYKTHPHCKIVKFCSVNMSKFVFQKEIDLMMDWKQ